MKKKLKTLVLAVSLLSCASCAAGENNLNDKYKNIWEENYIDLNSGFSNYTDIKRTNVFKDGKYIETLEPVFKASNDNKLELYNEENLRFIDKSNGYQFSLPSKNLEIDYTKAKYGINFLYPDSKLRVTKETNCYAKNKAGFMIYITEWLDRYINNPEFLKDNNLSYTHETVYLSKDIKEGFEASIFSIKIENAPNINYPFYNIALIKPQNRYQDFTLFLYKGKNDGYDFILNVLKSYNLIKQVGTSKNYLGQFQAKKNNKRNENTNNYFEKMKTQKNLDWGFFNASLVHDNDDHFDSIRNELIREKTFLNGPSGCDHKDTILPTYSHISWYDNMSYFPTKLAKEFARGNGFNGLPILQYTYQFTTNNNKVGPWNKTELYTPMFDILRGKYDEHFTRLAKDIKEYHEPVLFRLNNEMNTDWTSYCGMMTLLDPDLFIDTRKHLYNIFENNNVDNAIWIFNPIAKTCPYSNRGEDLNFYPGEEYVHMLGLTSYEMNNSDTLNSFREHYKNLYDKNKENYLNYPWIISEFACGSGGETSGELYRNKIKQAEWVRDMFIEFSNYDQNKYLQNIKGAVWFSVDDVIDGKIDNALEINENHVETLKAFREGFKLIERN